MDTTIGRYLFAQFISFESNGWNDDETSTGVAFGVLMYIIYTIIVISLSDTNKYTRMLQPQRIPPTFGIFVILRVTNTE